MSLDFRIEAIVKSSSSVKTLEYYVLNYIKIVLLIAISLFFITPVTAKAEDIETGASNEQEATPEAKTAPCKGLKPFNNLDELLYQFYSNLDSDCLFKTPVAELEKIWDIKILSDERAKPEAYFQLRMGSDFKNKPYESEKDAFYVEIYYRANSLNINEFRVIITQEYYNKYSTLFPDGKFPKLLPEPIVKFSPKHPHNNTPDKTAPHRQYWWKYNMRENTYYWLSSDQTRKIILGGMYGVTEITIFKRL